MGSRIYYSQAGQDLFVLDMLGHKKNGFYCEIGGGHPFESSNTFLLENGYAWEGFSIELDPSLVERFNSERSNPCILHDGTTYDYSGRFETKQFPRQIDYLSLDIEPAEATFRALQRIPFAAYRFTVITYEHEAYVNGPLFMELSRQYLSSRGYQLVVGNVRCFGRDFEDWWVDPTVVPETTWRGVCGRNIEFSNIFR